MTDIRRMTAVIFRKKDGAYEIDVRRSDPQTSKDREVIEVLHQKDGESDVDFENRVVKFVQDECR